MEGVTVAFNEVTSGVNDAAEVVEDELDERGSWNGCNKVVERRATEPALDVLVLVRRGHRFL